MIIGLTGPKLAGKGTIGNYLIEQYAATSYTMSGLLVQIAGILHLETSRAHLIGIATGLRSQFGEAILAESIQRTVAANRPTFAVIDGIRMSREVDLFSQLPDFRLVYVDAPADVRYHRALGRGEKVGEAEMTFDQFMAEETAVTEQQITTLAQRAALVLHNTGTKQELFDQLVAGLGLVNGS